MRIYGFGTWPLALRRALALVLLAAGLAGVAGAQESPHVLPVVVTIGLASGQASLTLRLPAGTAVSGPAGQITQVSVESIMVCTPGAAGGIAAGGVDLGQGPFRLGGGAGLLGWGARLYRGFLVAVARPGGLSLLNELGLEDYLRGVLPAEVNPAWQPEALKAQAVAARTFTLGRIGYHRKDGYDLCATTHCQAYAGAGAEKPATDAAVSATAGQVLTYNGRLISAYYHSSSGGHTENVENVWTGATPFAYLRGVPDPAESSPRDRWHVDLDWATVEAAITAKYPEIGRLTSLAVGTRSASGRAVLIELVGERGTARINGEAARTLFSLDSALFELRVEYGPVPVPRLDSLAVAPVQHTMAPAAVSLWYGTLDGDWILTPVRLSIDGRGWGHGVGLSQWGAKALAELGYTYVMILKYYYQGTEVEDWTPPQASPSGQGNGAVVD